jgi:hypothetical protein
MGEHALLALEKGGGEGVVGPTLLEMSPVLGVRFSLEYYRHQYARLYWSVLPPQSTSLPPSPPCLPFRLMRSWHSSKFSPQNQETWKVKMST